MTTSNLRSSRRGCVMSASCVCRWRSSSFFSSRRRHTIFVIQDTPAKRKQYEELLIQTFYLSNSDAKKALNMVRTLLNIRQVHVNEELNSLIVRETSEKMELVKKLIEESDKADAEVYLELELLEVNRTKIKEIGLKLSQYSVTGGIAPAGGEIWGIFTLGRFKKPC